MLTATKEEMKTLKKAHKAKFLPNCECRFRVTGMGKVNAAIGADTASEYDAVFMTGVCGGITRTVGTVVWASTFKEWDFQFAIKIPAYTSEYLREALNPHVVRGHLGTGDKIVSRRMPYDVVDMEGASIASVCRKKGIPFIWVKTVSDIVMRPTTIDFSLSSSASTAVMSALAALSYKHFYAHTNHCGKESSGRN